MGAKMSGLAQPNGDDYPDAAEKHLADANVLFGENRFDGAGYLTGYVVECVLKTYILIGNSPSPLLRSNRHHRLNELSQAALLFASMPNGRTAKYPLAMTPRHTIYDTQTGWRETIRYRASNTITAQQAQDWLTEAQTMYTSAIPQMKLDGLI
jgi:hypothetical protein